MMPSRLSLVDRAGVRAEPRERPADDRELGSSREMLIGDEL